MRITAPPVTIKDIWDAQTALFGVAGSYGFLMETNLDSKVSLAKADVSALALEASLTAVAALAVLIEADTAGLVGDAMRGTDGAALASAWTAALATILGNLSQVRIENLDSVGKSSLITASDVELLASDGEATHTGDTNYTKVKEFIIIAPGEYRVTAEIKNDTTPDKTSYTIYKNGVAHGDPHETVVPTDVYQPFTDDLAFSIGDLCQMYIKTSIAGSVAYVRLFKLKGDLGSGVGVELPV